MDYTRTFTSQGQDHEVSFPFDAIVNLMGPMGFRAYFAIYNSPSHQLKVLEEGLRWGMLKQGKPSKITPKQVLNMVRQDPKLLADVFMFYDSDILKPYTAHYSRPADEDEEASGEGEST